jgi:hypothetical protein
MMIGAARSSPLRDLAPIAIAILVYSAALFSPQVLADGDTWSHIAIGQWIIQHHAVPWTDPFSLTHGGAPWGAHEWLPSLRWLSPTLSPA